MDFTDEQTDRIDGFQLHMRHFVRSHASRDSRELLDWIEDRPEFIGPLCDMVAEYCANHGVDIRYPVHVTDPDGEERIQECADPTDGVEREYWMRVIDEKILQLKWTQHERAEDENEPE